MTDSIDSNFITFAAAKATTVPGVVSAADSAALDRITPQLGPTASLLLHRAARAIELAGDGWTPWTAHSELAAGLGVPVGKIRQALDRLVRFGYATWADPGDCTALEVRTLI